MTQRTFWRCLALAAAALTTSSIASAMEASMLHLDAMGSVGYSSPTVVSGGTSPTLISYGVGGTAALNFGSMFFAGATSDFRFTNQYSDVTAAVGNFRGTRWNMVSPTVGATWEKLIVKGDFQFLGAYNLSNTTAGGQDVAYKKPMGGRLVLLYPVLDKLHAGLQGEFVTFSQQQIGDAAATDLSTKLKMWQAGLTAAYVF